MKTKHIICMIALAVAFTSCLPKNDPPEPSYSSLLGTVENPSLSNLFTLVGDDGYKYIVTETKFPDFKPKTGTRMAIVYNMLSQNDEAKQCEVRLIAGQIAEMRDLLPLTKAVSDTVGNDYVSDVQMYTFGNLLNFIYTFSYSGNYFHTFDMVRDSDIVANSLDTVKLQFRHNAHNDYHIYAYQNFICFNISELKGFSINPDSVPIVVSVKEYSYDYGGVVEKKYNLMYKF